MLSPVSPDLPPQAPDRQGRVHRAGGNEYTAIACHRTAAALRRAGAGGLNAGGAEAGAAAAAAREAAWAWEHKAALAALQQRAEALLRT